MNVRDLEKAIGKIDEELAELREKRMLIVKERNELRDKEPRKVNKADNNPLYNYTNWVKTGVTNRGKYPSARNKKYLPAYYNSEGIKLEIFDKYGRCDNALLKKWKEERELWEKRMQENEDKEKEISGIIKKKEKLRDEFIDDYERLSYLVNMDLNEIGTNKEFDKLPELFQEDIKAINPKMIVLFESNEKPAKKAVGVVIEQRWRDRVDEDKKNKKRKRPKVNGLNKKEYFILICKYIDVKGRNDYYDGISVYNAVSK